FQYSNMTQSVGSNSGTPGTTFSTGINPYMQEPIVAVPNPSGSSAGNLGSPNPQAKIDIPN
ncbi:hypothetical protein, partial [Helicobacter salomonis]